MSRHRFVRNLDLDAELADDNPDDVYSDEEGYEGGGGGQSGGGGDYDDEDDDMSPEEQAQMISALLIVRARLKEAKVPVTDAEIQDSLWHYWFDIDKTVSWLKKEWEKKGEPGPPAELQPTPEQQPRPRPRRRRARAAAAAPAKPAAPAAPSPPLTALQRLSLARKQAAGSAASSAPPSRPSSTAPPTASNTPPPQPDASGKPTSKLALLAQKRREAASKATSTKQPPSTTATPPPELSSSPAPPPDLAAPTPVKPLSKLAQKMAAARAARADSAAAEQSLSQSAPSSSMPTPAIDVAGPQEEPEDELWSFAPSTSAPAPASVFFSILTTHAPDAVPPKQPSLANMHIAVRGDPSAAERRVREAFSPGVESPDDIVLRMRDGRAGTGAAVPPADQKSSKVEVVRAAKAAPALEPVSEVAAKAAEVESTGKPAAGRSRGKATDSTKAKRPDASTKGSAGVGRQTSAAGKEPPAKQPPSSASVSKPASKPTAKPAPRPPPAASAAGGQSATGDKSSGDGKKKPAVKPSDPKIAAKKKATASKTATPKIGTPTPGSKASSKPSSKTGSAASTPRRGGASTPISVAQQDLQGLHLTEQVDEAELQREREKYRERPILSMKQEELIAKVKADEEASGKKNISLVVVGHVDAGKSTLMGRLLYDLGELSEKDKVANERGSSRVGKSSFAFAWGLDALGDERARGVTIDIATTHFQTPHRNVTLLDAPGHRDFIPAMISGAAQADVALMVVDASPGEFEAGFDRGGQTREHAWLVRSLGVKEIIIGINKMDMVNWSQDRYDDIVDALKPFLTSAGFASAKTVFLPLAAMEGINVAEHNVPTAGSWYKGPALVDALDKVAVPERPYSAPLRIPLSNVFKGQTAVASGVAVQGRLASGVVQVGDNVRAVPGDVVASIRTIEVDEDTAPYAVAGQNVTLYLAGVDPNQLSIGTVLCPLNYPAPLVSKFVAQILVFDLQSPIIVGTAVELFHHSINVPATISKLLSISEKGQVIKKNPRVLQKGVTATVEITLRPATGSSRQALMPLETAAENKEMGRVLIRRGGETIAAGMVTELL